MSTHSYDHDDIAQICGILRGAEPKSSKWEDARRAIINRVDEFITLLDRLSNKRQVSEPALLDFFSRLAPPAGFLVKCFSNTEVAVSLRKAALRAIRYASDPETAVSLVTNALEDSELRDDAWEVLDTLFPDSFPPIELLPGLYRAFSLSLQRKILEKIQHLLDRGQPVGTCECQICGEALLRVDDCDTKKAAIAILQLLDNRRAEQYLCDALIHVKAGDILHAKCPSSEVIPRLIDALGERDSASGETIEALEGLYGTPFDENARRAIKKIMQRREDRRVKHIFISYSHHDQVFAKWLARRLERAMYEVWMDDDIPGGARWPEKIEQALQDSAALLVILSPKAVRSEWIKTEYGEALEKEIAVIPYIYRDCDLPMELKHNRQMLNHQEEEATGFRDLFNALPGLARRPHSPIDKSLIGSYTTFEDAAAGLLDVQRFAVEREGHGRIDLIGLPLGLSKYCATYLVGRSQDTLQRRSDCIQLALQLSGAYPNDDFVKGIARQLLQERGTNFRLHMVLVRGPHDKEKERYTLDFEPPDEWQDVLDATQKALKMYGQNLGLQIFQQGPVAMLYHLGAEHRELHYRAEVYQYDREVKQKYFRVLGKLEC